MKTLLERIDLYLLGEKGNVKKWSQKVKTKFHPEPGLFKTADADKILAGLGADGANDGTIMKRLNFYANRAGKNISPKVKKAIEKAKATLKARKEIK